MQGARNDDLNRKKADDEEDRAGFLFFPFFRGRRMEMIPAFLIVGLFLYLVQRYWEKPVQQETAQQEIVQPQQIAAASPPEAAKIETQRWGNAVIFPIVGKDGSGKNAIFDVAVLSKDFAWARKSATQLVQGTEPIPDADLIERVFTPELRDVLAQSSQVMAVGLASQEGQVEEETERANERAKTAAKWLSGAVKAETVIWQLNLGQFKKSGCAAQTETADSSWQRPVILVGVKSSDDGVNLTEAFADAINGKSNLPSRDCYTSFDLTQYR